MVYSGWVIFVMALARALSDYYIVLRVFLDWFTVHQYYDGCTINDTQRKIVLIRFNSGEFDGNHETAFR